jgi:DNA-binding NarL/FixJ family response regulator
MSKNRITVLLAEDHTIVREGFRALLELEDDIEVIGEAADGRQAIDLVKRLRPTVVVMDVAMASLNGLEATRQILKAVPTTRVLILSSHTDEAYIKDATESGAVGFLLKQSSAGDLSEGIREVNRGKIFFGPFVAERLGGHHQMLMDRSRRARPRNAGLTAREVEVLQLIAEGHAGKEIASQLGLSLKTIEKHREHLKVKLGIYETAGLTRYAIVTGVIESSVQLTII